MITLPLPSGRRLHREFHVALDARRRYGVATSLVDVRGRVLLADPVACERLAVAMNRARDARRFPESAVSGAEILAAGLLDEAIHLVLDAYRREHDPEWLARLEARLAADLGHPRLASARRAFASTFPTAAVAAGDLTVDAWLRQDAPDLPNALVALEERLAVRLANENPALSRLHELVDDAELGEDDAALATLMEGRLGTLRAPDGAGAEGGEDLLSLLRAPMRASPTSLEGQLAYVRERWGALLGPAFEAFLDRFRRTLDILAEARKGAGPPGPPGPAPVLDRRALRGSREDAPEAFSADADWMPRVVLVAKNAYVWLDQLSRRHGREIRRLDAVPDEALAELRGRGMTGLWLIGLWQRSEASARVKRLRGQPDAVASAYALYDYRIADDLGGEEAWRVLRDRADAHGLRLAADMVPNHVGIDGRWVAERPNWFVGLSEPPYPGYRFTGPDLADDPAMEIRIEDGYWDSSDAAVVFERRDPRTGERRYLYHGNDGTQLPWNDTAQLDYLNPEVREAVIGVILDVARRFPIIRFDAAMTLAREHVQRLWYPPPGHGGAIPSRSAHGSLSEEEFDRRMPNEFWREVVDRVAAEAPDTLLLAEAFWMMEGYFVRTLGMHRVYNSAFMNMLARESNGDYQELMRNVLSYQPEILARFVNFMNNPDEETAVEQFGDGDKAFGVTTLMATLPGLPMFGHGQVEGLREKYGMEYRRARLEEDPRPDMVERHRREIAPLLERRAEFAGTAAFRLLEVEGESGRIDDVFAYANRGPSGRASLVLYHNRYAEAHGRIHRSAPYVAEGGEVRSDTIAEALGLAGGAGRFVRWRDPLSGHEFLAPTDGWLTGGLEVRLSAYGRRLLLDVQELHDADGRYARLHDWLGGRGVPDLDDAFRDLELAPLHEAFVALAGAAEASRRSDARAGTVPDGEGRAARGEVDVGKAAGAVGRAELAALVTALDRVAPERRFSPPTAERLLRRADAWPRAFPERTEDPDRPAGVEDDAVDDDTVEDRAGRAWRRAWALAAAFDEPAAAARALRLERALARLAEPTEPLGAEAWAVLWTASLPEARPGDEVETRTADGAAPRAPDRDVGAAVDGEPPGDLRSLDVAGPVRRVLGVHEHGGVRWFRHEGFAAWAAAEAARAWMEGADEDEVGALVARLHEAERRSGYDFDRLVATPLSATGRPGASAGGPGDDTGTAWEADGGASGVEGHGRRTRREDGTARGDADADDPEPHD